MTDELPYVVLVNFGDPIPLETLEWICLDLTHPVQIVEAKLEIDYEHVGQYHDLELQVEAAVDRLKVDWSNTIVNLPDHYHASVAATLLAAIAKRNGGRPPTIIVFERSYYRSYYIGLSYLSYLATTR